MQFLVALTYPESLVKMWTFRLHPRSTVSKSVFQQDSQLTLRYTEVQEVLSPGGFGKASVLCLKGQSAAGTTPSFTLLECGCDAGTASPTLHEGESKPEYEKA